MYRKSPPPPPPPPRAVASIFHRLYHHRCGRSPTSTSLVQAVYLNSIILLDGVGGKQERKKKQSVGSARHPHARCSRSESGGCLEVTKNEGIWRPCLPERAHVVMPHKRWPCRTWSRIPVSELVSEASSSGTRTRLHATRHSLARSLTRLKSAVVVTNLPDRTGPVASTHL